MDEDLDPSSAHAFSLASHVMNSQSYGGDISRATTPGLPSSTNANDSKRYRPRTFDYFGQLPYPVEAEAERDASLQGILKELYIAVKAEDFASGALHWTRQLQAWLSLKFDMPHELRAKLAKLYFHLALAPGLDSSAADRFSRMVVLLTRSVSRILFLPFPISCLEYPR